MPSSRHAKGLSPVNPARLSKYEESREALSRRGRRPWVRFLRRFLGTSKGQGLVEFAMVLPLLIFLFFGIFEFGRFYFARLTMQHAVAEAARFAVTGNVLPDTLGNPMSRAQSIVRVITGSAGELDVDVDRVTIDPADAGGPGDVVRISASFTFRFIVPGYTKLTPDGELEFQVSTAMKNEPFYSGGGSP